MNEAKAERQAKKSKSKEGIKGDERPSTDFLDAHATQLINEENVGNRNLGQRVSKCEKREDLAGNRVISASDEGEEDVDHVDLVEQGGEQIDGDVKKSRG